MYFRKFQLFIIIVEMFLMLVLLFACVNSTSKPMPLTQVSEAWTPPGNAAVAIFSAVQIIVLNIYYSQLAIDLNNQENHRYSMGVPFTGIEDSEFITFSVMFILRQDGH